MKNWRYILILLIGILLCSACQKEKTVNILPGSPTFEPNGDQNGSTDPGTNGTGGSGGSQSETDSTRQEADFSQTVSDMFTDRDSRTDYDADTSVQILLQGDSIACSSDAVQISGTTATITAAGTYILSGTLEDGMIMVNAPKKDKIQLVLDGASITSKTSAPLYILTADKVFLTLAAGSVNTLANDGSFQAIDDNNINAAIFSKQDLTLNGTGSLTVQSPAGHGIVSKDDLVLTGGTYTIQAASHALKANDSVRILDASITADAGKDGIHAENSDDTSLGFIYIAGGTLDITAAGDGISAGAYLQIEGGDFRIVAGGGSLNGYKSNTASQGGFMGGFGGGRPGGSSGNASTATNGVSMKGLKVDGDMLIRAGTFIIDSADDSIHANGSITVNGGTFTIASGDDGFHADENINITDGTIRISESYEGIEALHITISGGDISLVATDDGINAADSNANSNGFGGSMGRPGGMGGHGGMDSASSNGTIVISGGTLYIQASGDGIDANGTLEISGGSTTVCGPSQGDTSTLDYDLTGTLTGGTFIGTGAAAMAQSFSHSTQGLIAVRVGNQAAGTRITVTDAAGNTLISHEPALPFQVAILSTPEMVKGETYTLTVGSSSTQITA